MAGEALTRLPRSLWRALSTFVFPSRCAVCKRFRSPPDDEPEAETSTAPLAPLREFLCPDCLAECRPLQRPFCSRCGLMFPSRAGGNHRCSDCLATPGHYGMARAVGIYKGGLMDLVHQLKYQGRLALVPPMGRLLRTAFHRHWSLHDVDRVVPIPLHPQRLRRRGFNQAGLLLRAWQKAAASDANRVFTPEDGEDILVRTRRTRSQTGLSRRERRRNIRGAFRVSPRVDVAGQHLVLLDDVLTTGATVEEAARTLKRAGAAAVDVLTFARTPK
jgi:ComF family protein